MSPKSVQRFWEIDMHKTKTQSAMPRALEQPVLECSGDRLHAVNRIELAHRALQITCHRMRREIENDRDLVAALAGRRQRRASY